MKFLKRIYYPIVIALATLMFILCIVDFAGVPVATKVDADIAINHVNSMSAYGTASMNNVGAHELRIDYIDDALNDAGLTRLTSTVLTDGFYTADYKTTREPSYAVVRFDLSSEDYSDAVYYATGNRPTSSVVPVSVTDIIVAMPAANGNSDTDAILVSVNYDSKESAYGANGSLAGVGSLLASIKYFVDNPISTTNDVFFVFSDAGEYNALGAYAFKHKFIGFDNCYSRVKLAITMDAKGVSGKVGMVETSKNNSSLIKYFSKMSGVTYASSMTQAIADSKGSISDFNHYADVPSLNFYNYGGSQKVDTASDTVASKSTVTAFCALVEQAIKVFGNENLDNLVSNNNDVYASYLGWGLARYSYTASYVLASIVLALLVATIVVSVVKKSFNTLGIVKGIFLWLLTFAFCALGVLVLLYVIQLLAAAVGMISIHSVGKVMFSSMPILIFAAIAVGALAVASNIFLKKILIVSGSDVIKANVILWAVASVITGYFFPQFSLVFTVMALVQLIVMLANVIVKPIIKAKFSIDTDRFVPYAVIAIIFMPLWLSTYFMLGTLMFVQALPWVTLLVVAALGTVLPYFDYLKAPIDVLVKKLPERTIKVERMVKEKVEDKAKKGRFTIQNVKKVTKEKLPNEYKNWHGIVAVMSICFVVVMIISLVGNFYSKNTSYALDSKNAWRDDAIIFVTDTTELASSRYVIYDKDAAMYMNTVIKGVKWNDDLGAYTAPADTDTTQADTLKPNFEVTKDVDEFASTVVVTPHSINSLYNVAFNNVSNVSKIVVSAKNSSGKEFMKEEYVPQSGINQFKLEGIKDIAIITIYGNKAMYSGTMVYEEFSNEENALQNFPTYIKLRTAYQDNQQVLNQLKGKYVIKRTKAI